MLFLVILQTIFQSLTLRTLKLQKDVHRSLARLTLKVKTSPNCGEILQVNITICSFSIYIKFNYCKSVNFYKQLTRTKVTTEQSVNF